MTGADDRQLVDRCIAGEPGAWRQFVDRFEPSARSLARKYLSLHGRFPDDGELDDIVQEVFLALTRKEFRLLRDFDPRYSFKTYLGVIVRTEVHRVLRKRRPGIGRPDELEEEASPAPEVVETLAKAEERDALTAALESLPARDAEVLRLRFLREMDYRGIAALLRIPEASVGQTLHRAKQKLLEKLRGLLGILLV